MNQETSAKAHARTPSADEVLRRVGRNVVIFQQVEHLLKFLNTHARFHAPASKFSERFDKHAASIRNKSMGELAGKLVDTVLQQDSDDATPDVIDEAWFGFRFTIETNAEFVERHAGEMQALVDRRNELVHHFLPRWQATVEGAADDVLEYLDAQREEAVRMLERLQGWARTVDAARKEHAAFFASDEGQREIDLLLVRSSRLVLMLGQIAMATPRQDGWTLLSSAGQLIKRDAPEELLDLRARFGQSNLKGVLLVAEIFDVADEPTAGGGSRPIYRINQRWHLEDPAPPGAPLRP